MFSLYKQNHYVAMQIDFHYCAIKVLAQMAGFSPDDAQLIAYASQYVDDATDHKKIKIAGELQYEYPRYDGEYFDPVCTAHKGLQFIKGLSDNVQRKIYIAFHFIPPKVYQSESDYIFTTTPNNSVARQLVTYALDELDAAQENEVRTQKLIKLGIALHSFADTWAHQGFSGRNSRRENNIENIRILENGSWKSISFWEQLEFNILPDIGHAEAYIFPDMPNLKWRYEYAESGVQVERDNGVIFLDAAKNILQILDRNNIKPEWNSIENNLIRCFSHPKDSVQKKFDLFKSVFPEINFYYDEDEWKKQAIKPVEDQKNTFAGIRYSGTDYAYNHDMKWFHFQREALKQREFILSKIKDVRY